MDKNSIKKFAIWARRELIARVTQKAEQFGITKNDSVSADAVSVYGHILSESEVKQRKALLAKIDQSSYEQVIEEVAYTWFNRFIALRFMEVNVYLPTHVRVFTDDKNAFEPQILAEALHLELEGLDREKVYALKQANDTSQLYKYLLITQCNALSAILPGMFQKIDDYTQLLFPDNILREGSVIERMIAMIPESDWKDAVQIIGWLYQYYNTEPKDKVFENLKKNIKIAKENIPAATQLFTPDWIVRYMVENSLGRVWINHLESSFGYTYEINTPLRTNSGERVVDVLKSKWDYYIDEAEQDLEVEFEISKRLEAYRALEPKDIICIDPCMGSGHILAYMFDVLMGIYESFGYSRRDAVRSIVTNNLYGLDIDERAAQLAYFAVMMKARSYDSRFLSRKLDNGKPDIPQPHVWAIRESNHLYQPMIEYFVKGDRELKMMMDALITQLHNAKEYGSIIHVSGVDFEALYNRFDEVYDEISQHKLLVWDELLPFVKVAEALSMKYDVVVTNPPYMGSSGMGGTLAAFVKKHYPDSKADLSTVFMERTLSMCKPNGYMSMINIPVWMFLSSFEKLRGNLLSQNTIINMVHPGRGIFGSDFGTTTFVIAKEHIPNYTGCYRRLFEKQGEVETVEVRERRFFEGRGDFTAQQDNFAKIPGSPISYWASKAMFDTFVHQKIGDIGTANNGFTTGDNDSFLRLWHEVDNRLICYSASNISDAKRSQKRWFPYNKGGAFRKWYGNNDYVINWYDDGKDIKKYGHLVPRSLKLQFRRSISWSKISISQCSFRMKPQGTMFDVAGLSLFVNSETDYNYIIALCNSCYVKSVLEIVSPTLNYETGHISSVPVCFSDKEYDVISSIVDENLFTSRTDWDSFETSWDFKRHPLIRDKSTVAVAYAEWERECSGRFYRLKSNEEKLNRIFIDIYGLGDELSPEVEDRDVTVRLADKKRDIKSLISYAVGCMFGRYSLYYDGILFAGEPYSLQDFIAKLNIKPFTILAERKKEAYLSGRKWEIFFPDEDGIIPITDDEYFFDDIVTKFVWFVIEAFGEETVEENLRFIADALEGKGTPREVIRNYFLNDFYADHCKIYQKRPIYWLFDSGKRNGFKALIYMHRYDYDTIARVRTDYVHEQQSRYRTAFLDLEKRTEAASGAERVKLAKRLAALKEQIEELRVYEEKIHHLADQMIRIDLDDGVKRNYAIFKDVLAVIK